jgi:hypothetical protein
MRGSAHNDMFKIDASGKVQMLKTKLSYAVNFIE